jgi:hypothetical protein
VFEFKSKTKRFTVTATTHQQCINISILLWQHISVLLDHLQAGIQRYEAQSVHIMYSVLPHYLQGIHKNSLKCVSQYLPSFFKLLRYPYANNLYIYFHPDQCNFIPLHTF